MPVVTRASYALSNASITPLKKTRYISSGLLAFQR